MVGCVPVVCGYTRGLEKASEKQLPEANQWGILKVQIREEHGIFKGTMKGKRPG